MQFSRNKIWSVDSRNIYLESSSLEIVNLMQFSRNSNLGGVLWKQDLETGV